MRKIFLRDAEIDSGGIGQGKHGYICVCGKCGKTWGRVEGLVNCKAFIPLSLPCPDCPGHGYQIPGSFLDPLIWWDYPNGRTLEAQLGRAGEEFLRHEALMAANYVIRKTTK